MEVAELAIELDRSGLWDWLALLSVPFLVGANGLFVAAEFALVAIRKTRVEEMVQQGVAGAGAVAKATAHLDHSIAATQLGITLASIALGVTEPALARLLLPLFSALTPSWSLVAAHTLSMSCVFIAITMLHVIFGELVPKTLALQIPDKTALWVAQPLVVFARLTRPLILFMNSTAAAITRLCGYSGASGTEMVHSVRELAMLIEDTEEAGILDSDQAEFLQNVFRLSDKRVGECMVPRERMASLELNTPSDKVLEAVRSGAHTRMPVYEGELDNIVGIVNTKDLFHLFSLQGVVILHDAIYPALFLSPEQTLDQALRLFRKAHRPMALVRGDQDRILGLLTLEDVLEEIVGDIEDEHDRPTRKVALRKVRHPRQAPKDVRPQSSPPSVGK